MLFKKFIHSIFVSCLFSVASITLAIETVLPVVAQEASASSDAAHDAKQSKEDYKEKASVNLPKGWFPAGDRPDDYSMGVDKEVVHGGSSSAVITSTASTPKGFGTLMQQCAPGNYKGKRVRFSAYLKSKDVTGWAGLWFRVDGGKKMLGFDNMGDRPIKGTTDWAKCENILDVPAESSNLAYGVLLCGGGQVWFDDVNFEIVGKDVPTTDVRGRSAPTNLKFED